METLKRDPVLTECEEGEFAKKARAIGYRGFDQDAARRKFRELLGSINMAPLSRPEVERYKVQVKGDADRAANINRFKFVGVITGVALIVVATAISLVLAGVIGHIATVGGSFALIAASLIIASRWRFVPWCVWSFVALKEYDQPVPRFALQTAIEISEAAKRHSELHPDSCISVKYFVDHFREEDDKRSRDPFLVASAHVDNMWAGYEYLEVWDEPSFDLDREI